MRTPKIAGMVAAAGLVLAGLTGAAPAQAAVEHAACGPAGRGHVTCFARWRPATHRLRASAAAVSKPAEGLGPADVRSAYKLPRTGGRGQTVAIVDAYDNPRVESNLKHYRSAWGLPACTTANGCFRKVDQRGGSTPPEGDPGWGVEIALDVQAVSAACSRCHILLVEADDSSDVAIGAAVNTAVRLGADVVSNSYGGIEYGGTAAIGAKYYTHPGVPIVASSGDEGFGPTQFPAVLRSTWAVGGTVLSKKGRTWKEKVWEFGGSGCSAWVDKPSWQHDPNCQMRTVADVSAVADNFAVYDTYGLGPDNGWIVVGGTSVSAPLISGMIGLAGNASTVASPSYLYSHRKGLKDVVGGSNGYCGRDYLCTGTKGYDAPSGLGSPRGLTSL